MLLQVMHDAQTLTCLLQGHDRILALQQTFGKKTVEGVYRTRIRSKCWSLLCRAKARYIRVADTDFLQIVPFIFSLSKVAIPY